MAAGITISDYKVRVIATTHSDHKSGLDGSNFESGLYHIHILDEDVFCTSLIFKNKLIEVDSLA